MRKRRSLSGGFFRVPARERAHQTTADSSFAFPDGNERTAASHEGLRFELSESADARGLVPVEVPVQDLIYDDEALQSVDAEVIDEQVRRHEALEMPEIRVGHDDRLYVVEGSDRVTWLRSHGHLRLPVAVDRYDADMVHGVYGEDGYQATNFDPDPDHPGEQDTADGAFDIDGGRVFAVPLSQLALRDDNPIFEDQVDSYQTTPRDDPIEVREAVVEPDDEIAFVDEHTPQVGEKFYWVVDGHHRALAAFKRGDATVSARRVDILSRDEVQSYGNPNSLPVEDDDNDHTAAAARLEADPDDFADACQYLIDTFDLKSDDLGPWEFVADGEVDPHALPILNEGHLEDRDDPHVAEHFENDTVSPVIVFEGTVDGSPFELLADGYGRVAYAMEHELQVPFIRYRFTRPLTSHDGRTAQLAPTPGAYLYCLAEEANLATVSQQGLAPAASPNGSWADGDTRPRVAFTVVEPADLAAGGAQVVLRVPTGNVPALKPETGTGDMYTLQTVQAAAVEVRMPDKSWLPLTEYLSHNGPGPDATTTHVGRTAAVGQVIEVPAHSPIFKNPEPMRFVVREEKGDKVKVTPDYSKDYGVWMPAESLSTFESDLNGRVPNGMVANSDNPFVDAVIRGEGQLLGKGDDGVAWKVGDQVVKMSTTVPYQPMNPGHRTHEEAAKMMSLQGGTAWKLKRLGVPGIVPPETVHHENKVFQVRPYVEIPEQLTPEELDEVQGMLDAMHQSGYAMRDDLQVGRAPDGSLTFFDIGKAAPIENHDSFHGERRDDISSLENLYRQHKTPYAPKGSFFEDAWTSLVHAAEVGFVDTSDAPRYQSVLEQARALGKPEVAMVEEALARPPHGLSQKASNGHAPAPGQVYDSLKSARFSFRDMTDNVIGGPQAGSEVTVLAVGPESVTIQYRGLTGTPRESEVTLSSWMRALDNGLRIRSLQNRNRGTGQYSFEGKWERLCVCGHPLGAHAGEPPHPCFNEDPGLATGEPCDCPKFRPSRKRKAMAMPTSLPEGWAVAKQEYESSGDVHYILNTDDRGAPAAMLQVHRDRSDPVRWSVVHSEAYLPGGWGAFLYERAMRDVSALGGTLESDTIVSNDAAKVWDRDHQRPDVEPVPRGVSVTNRHTDGPRTEESLGYRYRLRADRDITAAMLEAPPAMLKSVREVVEKAVRLMVKDHAYEQAQFAEKFPMQIEWAEGDLPHVAVRLQRLGDGEEDSWDLPRLGTASPATEVVVWHRPSWSSNPGKYQVFLRTDRENHSFNIDDAVDLPEAVAQAQKLIAERVAQAKKLLPYTVTWKKEYESFLADVGDVSGVRQEYSSDEDTPPVVGYVPWDLTGSRYESIIDRSKLPGNIRVEVFPGVHPGHRGTWDGDTLQVWVGATPSDEDGIARAVAKVMPTVEHEIVHAAQTSLQKGLGLSSPGGLPPGASPPSKSTADDLVPGSRGFTTPSRDYETEQAALPHPQKDIEFYPNLVSELSRFKEWRTEYGSSDLRADVKRYPMVSPRFIEVRKLDESRWQKMVTEFSRAALNEESRARPAREPGYWLDRQTNKRQVQKEDRANFARIPDKLVQNMLQLGYLYNAREFAANDWPDWKSWVKNQTSQQLAVVLENEYEVVKKVIEKLPRNSNDEWPDIEALIDRFRTSAGIPYAPDQVSEQPESWEEYSRQKQERERPQVTASLGLPTWMTRVAVTSYGPGPYLEALGRMERAVTMPDGKERRTELVIAFQRLFYAGRDWAAEVLQTLAIPAKQHKSVELAVRMFNRARAPKDIAGWFETNRLRMEMLRDAASWPERRTDELLTGDIPNEEVLQLGGFEVHNTVGASGPALENAKAIVEQAVSALGTMGLPPVAYGKLFLVGQIGRRNWAAWYQPQTDEVFLRPQTGTVAESARVLVHELGHRYWRKHMTREQKSRWGSHHTKLTYDTGAPEKADRKERYPVGTELDVIVNKKRPVILAYEPTGVLLGDAKTKEPIGKIDFAKFIKWTRDQEMRKRFPSSYSTENSEEHFCEALSFAAFGKLDAAHLAPLQEVLEGAGRSAAALGLPEWMTREAMSLGTRYYHGTSSAFLDAIMSQGLTPATAGANYGAGASEGKKNKAPRRSLQTFGGVYLTPDEHEASTYAQQAVENHGGNPLVLLIDTSGQGDSNKAIIYDEDVILNNLAVASGVKTGLSLFGQKSPWSYTVSAYARTPEGGSKVRQKTYDVSRHLYDESFRTFAAEYIRTAPVDEVAAKLLKRLKVPKSPELLAAAGHVVTAYGLHILEQLVSRDLGAFTQLQQAVGAFGELAGNEHVHETDHTVRSTQVIGFEGSPRIVGIVEFEKGKEIIKGVFERVPKVRYGEGAAIASAFRELRQDKAAAAASLGLPEWMTKVGAGELVERAIEQMAGQDYGLRWQLEDAARSLAAEDYEDDEIVDELWKRRQRQTVERAVKPKHTPVQEVQDVPIDPEEAKAGFPGAEFAGESEGYWTFHITTWEAAKRLGTTNWCIVRDQRTWTEYTEEYNTEFWFHVSKTEGPPAQYAVAVITDEDGNRHSETYGSQDEIILEDIPGVHDFHKSRGVENTPARLSQQIDAVIAKQQGSLKAFAENPFTTNGGFDQMLEQGQLTPARRDGLVDAMAATRWGGAYDRQLGQVWDMLCEKVPNGEVIRVLFADGSEVLTNPSITQTAARWRATGFEAYEMATWLRMGVTNPEGAKALSETNFDRTDILEAIEKVPASQMAAFYETATPADWVKLVSESGASTRWERMRSAWEAVGVTDPAMAVQLEKARIWPSTVREIGGAKGKTFEQIVQAVHSILGVQAAAVTDEPADWFRAEGGVKEWLAGGALAMGLTGPAQLPHPRPQVELQPPVVKMTPGVDVRPWNQEQYVSRAPKPKTQKVCDEEAGTCTFIPVDGDREVTAQTRKPFVAVDLDGTILEYSRGMAEGGELGRPLAGAANALRELQALGWRVSIYTARFEGLDAETTRVLRGRIEQHLKMHGVPFSDVWIGRKPHADLFIDDKAVGFSGDWNETLRQVTQEGTPLAGPDDEDVDQGDLDAESGPIDKRPDLSSHRPPGVEDVLYA